MAVGLSCGDSSGPDDGNNSPRPPIPVSVGDTITGTLRSASDTLRYVFTPSTTTEIAIFMQGITGNTAVTLTDTVSQSWIGEVGFVSPVQTSLLDRRSEHMVVQAGQTYTIVAAPVPSGMGGQFRFWIYEVNRAPEIVSATLPLGISMTTETLENSADIDEFQVSVPPGQEVIAYLRGPNYALPPQYATGLIAHVFEGAQNLRGAVGYYDAATDLQANASGRFSISSTSARIVIRNYLNARAPGQVGNGPYHFLLQPIVRASEHVASLVVGDTTAGESIDYVGDIDEFTVTATPRTGLNLFFKAEGVPASLGLRAEVLGVLYSSFPPDVLSLGTDTALTRQATGNFIVPDSGKFTVRVTGISDHNGLYRGSYRIFLYPINPQPELLPPVISPGDSVVGETIELPGDIDEFTLVATPAVAYNLVATRSNADTGTFLMLMAYDPYMIDLRVPAFTGAPIESSRGTGRFPLSAGPYTIIATGLSSTGNGFRGDYRIAVFPLSDGTELAPSSVAIGDTVTSELTPLGDVDRFSLVGNEGDLFNLMLQGLAAPSTGGFQAVVLDSAGNALGGVGSYTATSPLSAHQTGRLALPYTGNYTLWLGPGQNGSLAAEQGTYRFALVQLGVTTEHGVSALVPGDVVTAEPIDFPGDVDEFTLSAPPGTEVQVYLHGATPSPVTLTLDALHPSSPTVIRTISSSGFNQALGRVIIPVEGFVRLRVYGSGAPDSPTTGYTLTTFAIDRAPEGISAAIIPGDTVVQAISPIGDIDEYTFDVTAGQQVIAYFQTPNGLLNGALLLELLDPAGSVLATVTSHNPTVNLTDQSTGNVTAAMTGTYGIRVRGLEDVYGEGNYRFQVVLN